MYWQKLFDVFARQKFECVLLGVYRLACSGICGIRVKPAVWKKSLRCTVYMTGPTECNPWWICNWFRFSIHAFLSQVIFKAETLSEDSYSLKHRIDAKFKWLFGSHHIRNKYSCTRIPMRGERGSDPGFPLKKSGNPEVPVNKMLFPNSR